MMSSLHVEALLPTTETLNGFFFAKVCPKDLLLAVGETSIKPEEDGHLYPGPPKPAVPLKTRQHRDQPNFLSQFRGLDHGGQLPKHRQAEVQGSL